MDTCPNTHSSSYSYFSNIQTNTQTSLPFPPPYTFYFSTPLIIPTASFRAPLHLSVPRKSMADLFSWPGSMADCLSAVVLTTLGLPFRLTEGASPLVPARSSGNASSHYDSPLFARRHCGQTASELFIPFHGSLCVSLCFIHSLSPSLS